MEQPRVEQPVWSSPAWSAFRGAAPRGACYDVPVCYPVYKLPDAPSTAVQPRRLRFHKRRTVRSSTCTTLSIERVGGERRKETKGPRTTPHNTTPPQHHNTTTTTPQPQHRAHLHQQRSRLHQTLVDLNRLPTLCRTNSTQKSLRILSTTPSPHL